jgi:hypothetical protein
METTATDHTPSDATIVKTAIYPSIGVARVGNSLQLDPWLRAGRCGHDRHHRRQKWLVVYSPLAERSPGPGFPHRRGFADYKGFGRHTAYEPRP